jgi:hypothetical protein
MFLVDIATLHGRMIEKFLVVGHGIIHKPFIEFNVLVEELGIERCNIPIGLFRNGNGPLFDVFLGIGWRDTKGEIDIVGLDEKSLSIVRRLARIESWLFFAELQLWNIQ